MKQTRYLAIETSSPRLSLAIGDEHKTLATYASPLQWRHAESLFEGLKGLLAKRRWPVQSLTGVAVSIGPGSFTGIRIGLAAARALGQGLGIPVVGVTSLEAMANGAFKRRSGLLLCPTIDALRGQVFSALYEAGPKGRLRRILPETMATPQEWFKKVRGRSGKKPFWISPPVGCYPEAGALLDIARPRLARAGKDSYKSVLPLYIRRAAALERSRR